MNALIIDDEQEICILLKHILNGMNLSTESANSIRDGQEKYSSLHPGLIFLDINLPDGNGLDHIKDFKYSPEQTLIIISGSERAQDRQKAIVEGADGFLHKPFIKQQVVDIIHRVINK